MSGNHILNGRESKGEQRVEQVLKERLAHGSSLVAVNMDLY